MFDELNRRVRGASPAGFETGVVVQHELLRTGGEVSSLSLSQIGLEPRRHLKAVQFGLGIGDDNRERLLGARGIEEPIRKIDRNVSPAPVEGCAAVTAARRARAWIVPRRTRVARIRSGGIGKNQGRGGD